MCGRYNLTDDPATRLVLEILGIDLGPLPGVNLAPTETLPLVRERDGSREAVWARWWLVPSWSPGPSQKYAMFNARCETIAESRAFRGPFQKQRCVVPASSFIEWSSLTGEKTPYSIRRADVGLALAGIWDRWGEGEEALESFAIVTCEARADFRDWHHRMPVILNEDALQPWLSRETPEQTLRELMVPNESVELRVTPLSRAVSNARNKSPAALAAAGDEIVLSGGAL